MFCFPLSFDVSPTLSLETARLAWENQTYHFSLARRGVDTFITGN